MRQFCVSYYRGNTRADFMFEAKYAKEASLSLTPSTARVTWMKVSSPVIISADRLNKFSSSTNGPTMSSIGNPRNTACGKPRRNCFAHWKTW